MSEECAKLRVVIAFNAPATKTSGNDLDYISEAAVMDEANIVFETLQALAHTPILLPIHDLTSTLEKLQEIKPDLIFNLCEGYRGNAKLEMQLTGCWELLGIPFTGNRPLTMGLAQNKVLAKKLFEIEKIPTPSYQVYTQSVQSTTLAYPLIAKPACEDASLGITQHSVIHNFGELQKVVDELQNKYQEPILVEKYIPGREFNISLLGNAPPRVLPISEIQFSGFGADEPQITSYEAKWLPDHPLYQRTPAVCPTDIPADLKVRLEQTALAVYSVLMGRDYGRVDTRVTADGQIYVLEYNPNPDISPEAGFVKALRAAGIDYKQFVNLLIHQALNRTSHVPY
jgi:D-alanine-D-alanine ligase